MKRRWIARRSPRYSVHDLMGSFEVEIPADLLNISLLGMSVRSPTALAVGQHLEFELGEGSNSLRVGGKIVWSRPTAPGRAGDAGAQGFCDVGIQFDESLLHQAEALLRFLDSSTIVSLTMGVYGRFELDYEVPIKLRQRHELRVKELSSIGIVAETDVALSEESQIDLELPLAERRFISRARVVWVRSAAGGAALTRSGMEFYQPTEHHLELLRGYLRDNFQPAGPDDSG